MGDRATSLVRPQHLIAAAVALAQLAVVAPLALGPFTRERGSIESAYIADARFIAERFPDLSWSPLWYLGFPFELAYPPVLPVATAALGTALGSVPLAYRIVAALAAVLCAIAVVALARATGATTRTAVVAGGLALSGVSVAYAVPTVLDDAQRWTGAALPPPWRLVALGEYGEGPHLLALAFAVLAAAAVLRAFERPDAVPWVAAALAAASVLTNALAFVTLAVLLVPIALHPGVAPVRARVRIVGGAVLLAGVLAAWWYTPGFTKAIAGFSLAGGTEYQGIVAYWAFPLLLTVAASLFRAVPVPLALPAAWTAVFFVVAAAGTTADVALVPQPKRYAMELEVAGAVLLAGLVAAALRSSAVRVPAAVALATVVALSVPGNVALAERLMPDQRWTEWSEHRVAQWLAERVRLGERAYLSGSHAFWLNVFADVPQVRGGHDYAAATPWWAHVDHQVRRHDDAALSALWLEALGVRYVVAAARPADAYDDFSDVRKFDGTLPVRYEAPGVRIHEVPLGASGEVFVVDRSLGAPPRDALDRERLDRYVRALREPTGSAVVERDALGHRRITVRAERPSVVIVRQAFDEGWEAVVDGTGVAAHADPLGWLAVPVPAGTHQVEVRHRFHTDRLFALLITAGGVIALAGMPRSRRRSALGLDQDVPADEGPVRGERADRGERAPVVMSEHRR